MHVCFCCVCFLSSVLSQEIGWEEHLQKDVFCVGWDVKPKLNKSFDNSLLLCSWSRMHVRSANT